MTSSAGAYRGSNGRAGWVQRAGGVSPTGDANRPRRSAENVDSGERRNMPNGEKIYNEWEAERETSEGNSGWGKIVRVTGAASSQLPQTREEDQGGHHQRHHHHVPLLLAPDLPNQPVDARHPLADCVHPALTIEA